MSFELLSHQIPGRNGVDERKADFCSFLPLNCLLHPQRFPRTLVIDPDSGHEVPAYSHGTLAVGQAAFQMFSQIMSNNSLSSTDGSGGTLTGTTTSSTSQATSKPNSSPLDAAGSLWSVLVSGLVALVVLPF